MARYIQILCLSTLNLINQRNVSHIKLTKYCDIDARLPEMERKQYFELENVVFVLFSDFKSC